MTSTEPAVNIQIEDFQPLSTTRLLTGRRQLNRDFRLEVDSVLHVVPKGFETDFSSYPWYSRVIVRFDRVDVAGVIHDWLYYNGDISRQESDDIWRKVAVAGHHGANPMQAWLSWVGLRLFGWYAWNQHRKREKKIY